MTERTLSDDDLDIVEVIIACCDGQMGREAAREILFELDAYGFEVVRKAGEKSAPARLG